MKRLHLHIRVDQLGEAIQLYSKSLEAELVKCKPVRLAKSASTMAGQEPNGGGT